MTRRFKLLVAEGRCVDPQFVVNVATAAAMAIVLPAWPFVILKCTGVL